MGESLQQVSMTRFCTQWRNKHWARTATNFHHNYFIIPQIYGGGLWRTVSETSCVVHGTEQCITQNYNRVSSNTIFTNELVQPQHYANCVCRNQRTEVSHWQSETKILIISAIFVEFVALVHLRRLAASSKSRSTENVSFLMILEICRMVNESDFCEKLKIFIVLWKSSKIMFDLYSIELKNHQNPSKIINLITFRRPEDYPISRGHIILRKTWTFWKS